MFGDGLNPDDPRPASQQIANLLRAAIVNRQLAPGDRLPSQGALAQRYGVARETVKSALRILRDEHRIVTRQGCGTYVRSQAERPIGLRPHIEAAFTRPHVTVDFAGFSGETLHGALQEPLDQIRAGMLTPESIAVRILLPDLTTLALVPSPVDASNLGEKAKIRERARRIAARHTEAIVESVLELAELGLTRGASVEIRHHGTAALFKLYLLNGEEAFFGFYPLVTHTVTIEDSPVNIVDVLGKDVPLFHFVLGDQADDIGTQYVDQAKSWFNSVWAVARPPAA
ncbi:GntR family transcriptional regulator [Virgisporangium ochraceum]|uniref:GntR family transcriptional regulator n=1 Tax=Virgisporangium ochraceum TaxID=65505 RepID=A0A8J4EBY1_9ACTN|nr:winged helix-turn-helix domain-containing protein [Virgisporangium ochraceum]GIJ66297.1 GntR family transcriptional regulator [Virgisporangium ochraceum]